MKNMKKRNIKVIVIVIMFLLLLIVALKDPQSVETKVLFMTITMPRALLPFLTFFFGFVVGSVSVVAVMRKGKKFTNNKT